MTDLTIEDVDEGDLLGKPLKDVPKISPDEKCHGRKTEGPKGEKVFAGYCGARAGKGTDHLGEGRCKHHGGRNDGDNGQGAPDDNTNAVGHALFTESNRFYQQVIDDPLRELCDKIYDSYLELFREANGREPVVGECARLSEIAINHIKIIHADNWAADKPEKLKSGNALVDREERVKPSQHDFRKEIRYKETAIVATQQKLRREDRAWLKEYGLLGADAIDISVDGAVDHSHDHEHGLDEGTQQLIEDLAEDMRA